MSTSPKTISTQPASPARGRPSSRTTPQACGRCAAGSAPWGLWRGSSGSRPAASTRSFGQGLRALEAGIEAGIAADPDLAERRRILLWVPGFGPNIAATFVAQMPELGGHSAKEATGRRGVAPMTRQSGQWRRTARTSGGRHAVRQALSMPALSAIRHNPDMRRTYERLCAAGKPPTVAITAVMRKLVVLANTLLAEHRTWRPHPS